MFRVNLGEHGDLAEPMMIIDRNLGTRPLIDLLLDVVDQLYRYHSKLSFREDSVAAGTFAEVRRDDASGSWTSRRPPSSARRCPATDLARAINDFNRASFDLATRRGARIVKTIGDEVMFVALDAAAVAHAAHRPGRVLQPPRGVHRGPAPASPPATCSSRTATATDRW